MGPVGGALRSSAGTRWNSGARGIRPARGQSLVEFALVLPLFLLLIFAVVEYSLINSAIGSYNFAAKDAARYGAINGQSADDLYMLNNYVNPHVIGVVAAQPVEADIFEATESGVYDPASANQDKWTYSKGAWTAGTQGWLPSSRNEQLVSQDYIGVRIVYNYTYVTAFFSSLGATITLTSMSVQRIEPQEIYHHPALGSEIALAAPDSPFLPAPTLGLVAVIPAWVFRARRARAPDHTDGKEQQA